ncbi:unnamed protein product (macronuclear) [Paramecium tetraurelia]|uniref:Nucleoplasmin-like domain-containing protein n=1 Tax=Paramecium tetraurelia TaxID=5888 RepID=A0BS96_PARTE|nr:uncharacterized protein GSPATT00031644001 [Paramecium tetraurelia]CAK61413.1 unnamed protein product [Paramecium tetraurelia]|eukprot:XP_001428811.1 hypothetical protein (macronuclear) [Paramecium tetraurelia strain d4-2]
MFYGIQLSAGESQTIQKRDDHNQFVLSQAVLVKGTNLNVLMNGIVIASLNQKISQMPLRIKITPEQQPAKLEAKGNGSVHLCGYYMQFELENEDADLQSVAQLLKQSNLATQPPVQKAPAIPIKKTETQPKWDEMDWEDEQFQKRVK